jgi:hypothetical protein
VGSGTGVFSPAVGQTIGVGYGEFRALEPADVKRHRTEKRRVRAGGSTRISLSIAQRDLMCNLLKLAAIRNSKYLLKKPYKDWEKKKN